MVIKGIKKREREGKRGEKEEFIEGEDGNMPLYEFPYLEVVGSPRTLSQLGW